MITEKIKNEVRMSVFRPLEQAAIRHALNVDKIPQHLFSEKTENYWRSFKGCGDGFVNRMREVGWMKPNMRKKEIHRKLTQAQKDAEKREKKINQLRRVIERSHVAIKKAESELSALPNVQAQR